MAERYTGNVREAVLRALRRAREQFRPQISANDVDAVRAALYQASLPFQEAGRQFEASRNYDTAARQLAEAQIRSLMQQAEQAFWHVADLLDDLHRKAGGPPPERYWNVDE